MAASGINFDSTIDEPLEEKSCPGRLFEDRAGTFDKYEGSLILYGLKHKNRYPLMDLVCDAFWNMGFDVKNDYFKSVARLSKMKNSPIVCEFKSNHTDLGLDILEAYGDVEKIPRADLLDNVHELIISCYLPPPPQLMLNVSGRISRANTDCLALIMDICKDLGLDCVEENISYWEVVMEKTGGILVEFSNMTLTKKLFNMREFVSSMDQKITAITFYREKLDYYYDKMLMLYGLNTKRKDCTTLMLEICQDLGVDVVEDDIVRCEWFYGKATRYKALKSPLVCEFATEDKRIDVFGARHNEGDVRADLRFQPRPRRSKAKKTAEEGEEAPVEVEEVVVEDIRPLRPIGIVPFVSLPHYMLYVATKEFTKQNKEYQSLPMTFYGRIRLGRLQEPVTDGASASPVDVLTQDLDALSLEDIKFIKSPLDLWNIDKAFSSSSLDKYYIFSDPYFSDKGLALEPYEWFSLPRTSQDKRISRR